MVIIDTFVYLTITLSNIVINLESLEPFSLIEGTSDFLADFSLVNSILKDDQPLYIVYRDENVSSILFSYVPDTAKVRSKMIYASTTNSLINELGGSEQFSSNIFITNKNEFSIQGWKNHLKHVNAKPPLTKEEESLQEVLEKEQDYILGTNSRKNHLPISNSVGFKVDPSLQSNLQNFKDEDSISALSAKIDTSKEVIILDDTYSNISTNEIPSIISSSSPQFTFYKLNGKFIFIYTCPSSSKIKERMIYASNRQPIIKIAESYGIKFEKIVSTFISNKLYKDVISLTLSIYSLKEVNLLRLKVQILRLKAVADYLLKLDLLDHVALAVVN